MEEEGTKIAVEKLCPKRCRIKVPRGDSVGYSPSRLQETIGRGFPVAMHSRIAVWWTVKVRFSGPTRIIGSLYTIEWEPAQTGGPKVTIEKMRKHLGIIDCESWEGP